MSSIPTSTDFANEVKSDRLKVLYQGTFAVSAVFMLFVVTFGASRALSGDATFALGISCVLLMLGSTLTRLLLEREQLDWGAWAYALSFVVVIGTLMYFGDDVAEQMVPFIAPVIVFVVGLLITPASTIVITGICATVIIGVPAYKTQVLAVDNFQMFSILLMLLSAVLSAQVAGELYQVTQWALMNYQRERRVNDELFEKRQQLQLSLKRSEILSENLQATNQELETAKSAAEDAKNFRGQFLANMSHELRTPLNAIIGFSETMLQFPIMYDDEPLPNAYERDLSQIYSSGRQLLFVINDILDLAKVDAGKLEVHLQAVDPTPIVNAVMSTTKGLLGNKPVLLEKDAPEPLPKVWADETRLRQVLLNLYSNAAKYTDEGSIKITVHVAGDMLQFDVKDTGLGIPENFHQFLFKEFQQASSGGRDPRSGSGLGLAISKQLVTLMSGDIWMESEVGKGSTFSFAIPLYKEGEPNGKPVEPAQEDQPAIKTEG